MDISKNRETLVIIILTLLFVFSSSLVITYLDRKAPKPYSSYSPEQDGTKGAYLLLESLGFSVSHLEGGVPEIKQGSVLILMEPSVDYVNGLGLIDSLNEWVHSGSTMVLAGSYKKYFTYASDGKKDPALSKLLAFQIPDGYDKPYYDLPYGSGEFRLVPDESLFITSGLRQEGTAYNLVSSLWDFHDRPLTFYEKSPEKLLSLSQGLKGSPAALLSTSWQLILLQCLLGFILLILFTGKRMGPPVSYREEILRGENEDVTALSYLMDQAGLGKDAFMLYYRQFEKDASSYFKTKIMGSPELLEDLWGQNKLKFPEKLKEIHHFMTARDSVKLSSDYMVKLFQSLDILREEINKHE